MNINASLKTVTTQNPTYTGKTMPSNLEQQDIKDSVSLGNSFQREKSNNLTSFRSLKNKVWCPDEGPAVLGLMGAMVGASVGGAFGGLPVGAGGALLGMIAVAGIMTAAEKLKG